MFTHGHLHNGQELSSLSIARSGFKTNREHILIFFLSYDTASTSVPMDPDFLGEEVM
jgi:hypothetical protein